MRPIRLEITGLQSFSKKQIVDFDALTTLGLFGIFGETGSGKSTILDAMIFAIFDEIPRTMGSKGKNIRPCLNQDSDILEVYFKFALGKDIFEITRCYKKKFSRKGEEKFEQSNPILILNGDVIADTVKNVEGKINEFFGISVNDFTRSVVLPQGKFSEFLKLKGADKMTMLENIFDLERYGTKMSEKIKVRNNKLKEEITSLENQIKGKGDCSLETINNLKATLATKEEEYNNLLSSKKELSQEYSELKELKILFEKLESYTYELQRLDLDKEDINLCKNILTKHEVAQSFKSVIDEITNLKESIFNNQNNLLKSKSTLENLNSALENLKEQEREKQIELDKLILELNNLKVDYTELDNLRKGDQYIRSLKFKEKLLEETLIDSNSISSNLKSLYEKLKVDNLSLESENNNLQNLEKIDKDKLISLEDEIKKLNADIKLLEEKLKEKNKLEVEIKEDNSLKISITAELENCLIQIKNINQQHLESKAFEISKNLIHGESCPVCGSKDHPNPAKEIQNIDTSILDELSKNKERLEKSILEIDTKLNYRLEKLSELNRLDNIDILKSALKIKENNINDLKVKEKEILENEKELNNKISTLKSNIKNSSSNITQKENDLNKLKEKLTLYEKEILEERENISLLKLESDSLDFISSRKTLLENMDKEYREVFNKKENLDISLRGVRDNIFKDFNAIQTLSLEVISLEEKNNHLKDSYNDKKEWLKIEATKNGFLSIEDILNHILENSKINILKDKISSYEIDSIRYQSLKDEVMKSIDNRVFNKDRWSELEEKLEGLTIKENNLFKEITEHRGDLNRLEQLALESKELLEKIDKLILKQDDIITLQKKFEGRKFVKFLARKKLDYIAYEASKRLQKITRGRYILTVDNNCDFNIVDAFNSNFTRECSTLSGGETFIVSLVLALALSSQLQLKGKIQLEFFFLDEGFGTLDATLLDRVIEILEEIRWKDAMKIGIISHVEDLKIRIPRRLEVTPAVPGESGSIIKLI
ncbi:MAG: SbcC/MukB-like Walker B domain-containing protein [Cetobacterium sp.]|uniref:SbcC/MukB-like Walker B domain-containing protein n=2 Tax=Cetobacterium TaxID=180162 RepID=UPI001F066917|nr:SbcC/MukB-like Walker B domain-containing protein [Cetobacterium somerae]UPO98660.1 AAA family ATPase [Cetobacterium somerae]